MTGTSPVQPTIIGYLPKRTAKRPGAAEWVKVAAVEEICSVSDCISSVPDQRDEDWRQNRLTDFWLYHSAEAAERGIPDAEREAFDIYAYGLLPVEFRGGGRHPFTILPSHVHTVDGSRVRALDGSFERLGWDAVNRQGGSCFECSPLSCNRVAEEVSVNRHCLFDDVETALRRALEFGAETGLGRCEAGPYYVVEVWRRKQSGTAGAGEGRETLNT